MKDLQSHKSPRSCEKGESYGVTTGKVEACSKIAVRPGAREKPGLSLELSVGEATHERWQNGRRRYQEAQHLEAHGDTWKLE